MTFLRLRLLWVWPISGDYEVVALDPDYRWSLVGHPSRDYAWILAREPRSTTRSCSICATGCGIAGYDPCRLILTADADPRRGRSLCALP